jgi:hypothetical protein
MCEDLGQPPYNRDPFVSVTELSAKLTAIAAGCSAETAVGTGTPAYGDGYASSVGSKHHIIIAVQFKVTLTFTN